MPEIYSDQLVDAVLMAGIICFTYKTAQETGEKQGRLSALWKGLPCCLVMAVFAGFAMGGATCEAGEPLFGGCKHYTGDGPLPT